MKKRTYVLAAMLSFFFFGIGIRLFAKYRWDDIYNWGTCAFIGVMGVLIIGGFLAIFDGFRTHDSDKKQFGLIALSVPVALGLGFIWVATHMFK